MAQPSIVHRFNVELSDIDRGCYQSLEWTVARHPSETAERLVARVLAVALCWQDGLEFTKGVCAGDEPDAWLKAADDRVALWLEVGLPDVERIVHASRHAEAVAVLAYGEGLRLERLLDDPALAALDGLFMAELPLDLLTGLAAGLARREAWSLTVTDNELYVSRGDETLSGPLRVKLGERAAAAC